MIKQVLITICILSWTINLHSQCTIFMVSDGQNVLVGNNEDYGPALKKIWITPPQDELYGTILFGFDQGYDNFEGGVNDQGLFVDAAAISVTDWTRDPDKKDLSTDDFLSTILANCKDLNDVQYYIDNYNHSSLKRGQYLFADRSGESAVLVWYENDQRLIFKDKKYQVISNFPYLKERNPFSLDTRDLIARKMLENPDYYSIEGFKKVLFATHDERGGNPTSYSTIFDLKNMQIYLYNFYNFLEPHIIDINVIISRGKQTIKFSEIFCNISFMEEYHYADKLLDHLTSLAVRNGVSEVLNELHNLEQEYSVSNGLSGAHINWLGGRLLDKNMIEEAIEVYAFNVKKCPSNANAYHSLGEAYMRAGKKELAIINFKKSLDLNPKNTYVKEALKELEGVK